MSLRHHSLGLGAGEKVGLQSPGRDQEICTRCEEGGAARVPGAPRGLAICRVELGFKLQASLFFSRVFGIFLLGAQA